MIDDTIAAIATAPGEAGIGIVRLSGPMAVEILDQVFVPSKGKSIKEFPSRRLTHGYIVHPHTQDKIDEALVVYMKGPHTYTAEDVAEIDCHGGIVPVRRILSLVLSMGARMAEPGEFTKRAFLNGRIDLAQAEAVMDVISAKTEKGFDIALGQLEGSLSKEVHKIRANILEMIAHITVNIDFPDEDIEEITYDGLEKQAKKIVDIIDTLLSTAHSGKIIREGLKTVIIGKPNVGKSSLMNALLKESRAIVTEIPGTTRDVIEEYVSIQGIPLKIVDTAGIRETEDLVEKIGVARSKEFFNKADLIIFVLNASESLTEEDRQIIQLVNDRDAIILLNKTDLPMVVNEGELQEMLPGKKVIRISVTEGIGLKEIEDTIAQMVYGGQVKHKELSLVTNVRHQNALERAKRSMEDAVKAIQTNMPLDFVEVDVRDCWEYLGEITGDTVGEDIIDRIFANFCLGK
ncbi:MAG: tRNA uridine-5-carboxymethylaminomethyl(34) synthesis GTPase MnmE [Anaerosolibacter sp.]|jgi:tRNA modification GTPase|uniref:tRNA uridine-5-carboxymethylaminomethyl(34) synthesis GTPase MnmE n=1 Tax=Anaerosolibacter sp. TaxID=1872527 RepID=UPI00260B03C6|nr:tRNA uridine-5-carboxymethylaminomethyl(34) synthesis GTPase MnmE [Anaerosolibacter sp.]MDF2548640.1 tRNA uridine-5-carboxymethylaminomethyl(34) synthesis GTPase MnmE [Anaerosolibacter sp.]